MKNSVSKKGSRSKAKRAPKIAGEKTRSQNKGKFKCAACSKALQPSERVLFVEEEKRRIFCTEDCIFEYFNSDIKRLEKEYERRRSPNDLPAELREKYSHLRWATLQAADETWREKTLKGDYLYHLISEFKPEGKKIWCVCICLFLRGQPSFLFLSFVTKNAALVNLYRRGETIESVPAYLGSLDGNAQGMNQQKGPNQMPGLYPLERNEPAYSGPLMDGLAESWTEDETLRAQLVQQRRQDDIPHEDFKLFERCLDDTLQVPDEVWTVNPNQEENLKIYHFVKQYSENNNSFWYIAVIRETENDEQVEILDAFPTQDLALVEKYRTGIQEIGIEMNSGGTKLIH